MKVEVKVGGILSARLNSMHKCSSRPEKKGTMEVADLPCVESRFQDI